MIYTLVGRTSLQSTFKESLECGLFPIYKVVRIGVGDIYDQVIDYTNDTLDDDISL